MINNTWLYMGAAVMVLSVTLNVFFIWYGRQLLSRFGYLSLNISNLRHNLHVFFAHLKKVYESELFYGEPTLELLLKHAREIGIDIESFFLIFNIVEDDDFEQREWHQFGTGEHEAPEAETDEPKDTEEN